MKLSEIRKACEGATPGPWETGDCQYDTMTGVFQAATDLPVSLLTAAQNAHFIALARTALPALLEAVQEMLISGRYVEGAMADTLAEAGIEADE